MKKTILGIGIGLVIGLASTLVFEQKVNCDSCGEPFNNLASVHDKMCDMCYGWFDCLGANGEEGYLYTFDDGTKFYFDNWKYRKENK